MKSRRIVREIDTPLEGEEDKSLVMSWKEVDDRVDHPPHYGGKDWPYEVIKVIENWGLDFHLGNCIKYLYRADKKADALTDLKKARWYLDRKIAQLSKQ